MRAHARCGSACVCRVGAWRHKLATAGARSQESRRANAVRLTLRQGRQDERGVRGVVGVRSSLARGWRGMVRVRVSRWCMVAHAGSGGRPFSRISAGEGLASHPAPRMMPSPHWKRQACVARWRVMAGGCVRVRMRGVAACVACWRVKAGVCVRVCGVAGVRSLLARDGGDVVRVSRWCMAAYDSDGGSPISRVSAGEAVRLTLRRMASVGL